MCELDANSDAEIATCGSQGLCLKYTALLLSYTQRENSVRVQCQAGELRRACRLRALAVYTEHAWRAPTCLRLDAC
jgi:hypothetical protein